MPTLEELLKANDQSLSSFLDQDSEKEIVSDALAAPVRPEYLQFIEKYGRKPNQKKELPSFYEPKQSAPLVDAAASFFSNPPTEPLKSLPLPPGGGIGLKGEILAGDIEPEPKTTNPGRIPSSSLRSGMERQRSTPMYDVNTEDEVIKAAMQQPKSVDYLRALEKEKQLRDEKINELKNKKYSTREHSYASVTDEDRAKELDAYDSRSLQERAEERFAKEKAQKEKLNEEISNLNNELGYTTNIFKKETLEQELKNKQSELAKLSGDAEMGVEPLVRLPSSEIPSSVDEILSELEKPSFKAEPSKPVSSGATQKSVLKDEIKKTTTGAGQPTAAEVVKQDREEELTKALGSQAAREIAQYEDLMNRFRQAQEKERNARLLAGLAQGSEMIGSALARAKAPDSKYWESFVEQAGLEKQQIKEKQDFEQEAQMRDPNSFISKEYQSLAKAMGINVSGKEPASVLIKTMPYLQQYQSQKENREARLLQAQIQREQIAAGKQVLADERINKGYVDMTKRIEGDIASARSAFGRSANVMRAAGAIEALASKFKADELSYQEIQELAKSLDGMLAQGAPTITGTQKLVPTSFIGDSQKIASYLLNIPKGAKQGEFVKRMLATVGREKEYAKKQILKTQTELLSGYEHLKKADPDRWDRTLTAFGIPTEGSLEKSSESSKEKKETVKLPKKQFGNAGKIIVSKDGKRYKINDDETTATEI